MKAKIRPNKKDRKFDTSIYFFDQTSTAIENKIKRQNLSNKPKNVAKAQYNLRR